MIDGTNKVSPQIGMGATVCGYSDRYACTVVWVDQPKGVLSVRKDIAKRTDKNGISEDQEYSYTPDSNGIEYSFKYII
jgi:hypothetical protein